MIIMNKPNITTIIVIVCILILGLYAAGEVNYFAHKNVIEKNITSPVVIVDKVGIEEKINNESLDLGVMTDMGSSIPTKGDVYLFGHRTLQGSPFLRLNEVVPGDTIILEWPDIGEVTYKVVNQTIVPATYQLHESETKDHVLLITCNPIGSTENRLIIDGQMTNVSGIDEKIIESNPHESYAYIISGLFLVIGLIVAFIYPKDTRIYILATVLIISAILFYFCFNPISSQVIYDKIIFLNGGL